MKFTWFRNLFHISGEPLKKTPKHKTLSAVELAEKTGEAERAAISAAVCAGMADGSFYQNPKRTITTARNTWKSHNPA